MSLGSASSGTPVVSVKCRLSLNETAYWTEIAATSTTFASTVLSSMLHRCRRCTDRPCLHTERLPPAKFKATRTTVNLVLVLPRARRNVDDRLRDVERYLVSDTMIVERAVEQDVGGNRRKVNRDVHKRAMNTGDLLGVTHRTLGRFLHQFRAHTS